jgi:MSHA pilin protein MshA
MKKQAGFTLIELIMVIVILGILSAFALPRFADLSGDAERAALEGARASIQSASAITHAKWLAQGSTGTVDVEGNTITMVNGYPNLATIANTINTDGLNAAVTTADVAGDGVGTGLDDAVIFFENDKCFSYIEAGVNGVPTISQLGTYDDTGANETCI